MILAGRLRNHHVIGVMDQHLPCDFINGIARVRHHAVLPHEVTHFEVGIQAFQQVVGLDDADKAGIIVDDGNNSGVLGSNFPSGPLPPPPPGESGADRA